MKQQLIPAIYKASNLAECAGNPLIEALPGFKTGSQMLPHFGRNPFRLPPSDTICLDLAASTWKDIRMIGLLMASCAGSGGGSGRNQFATKSSARSDVPTQTMYRTMGITISRRCDESKRRNS